jgi:1-acyl-sn-glycerol-3-phosphate acyltransferase
VLFFITLISVILCISVYYITKNPSKANVVASLWGRMLTKAAFAKVEVIKKFSHDEGNENYVLMANHQSAFDIFILYGYLPFDFTFLSKKEVFQIPLFGLAMKVVDAIAVDRENKASLKKTIKDMENYIRRGRSLLIFPEGTRSEDGELLDFKKGGFLLAKKSNVKILPVTVINSNKILKKGSFLITPFVNVTMILNEPIPVENANLNELMEQVRGVMQENLKNFQSAV